MSLTIDIRDFPARLNEALAAVASGAEIVLTDGPTPRARLVSLSSPTNPRTPGLHPGAMTASPDFDAELPEEFWTGRP
jgi:antitoxin (DNA-binding transcriptional repressor) of toxin-antitoxin stability system